MSRRVAGALILAPAAMITSCGRSPEGVAVEMLDNRFQLAEEAR